MKLMYDKSFYVPDSSTNGTLGYLSMYEKDDTDYNFAKYTKGSFHSITGSKNTKNNILYGKSAISDVMIDGDERNRFSKVYTCGKNDIGFISGGLKFKITSEDDLLLNFKFRNSSKNHENLDMYHIEVRPFVLALKALLAFRKNGYVTINPHILSAIVTYSFDEFDSLKNNVALFQNPKLTLRECRDTFYEFSDAKEKEVGRATLFLKPYLKAIGVVEDYKIGNKSFLKILPKIDTIKFAQNSVYCNGTIGSYKLTPMIGKLLYNCYCQAGKQIDYTSLFDENFETQDFAPILGEFKNLGIIEEFGNTTIKVSGIENQYAINPYSEFFTIREAEYVDGNVAMKLHNSTEQLQQVVDSSLCNDLETLKAAALSSDGTLYEKTLYGFLKNHLNVFTTLNWYGQATTGQRLSDLAGIIPIYENGEERKILIVMECKAGNAIASFNERKEREDIVNTMKKFNDTSYDGIWYWVADSNALPEYSEHGGYRSNELSKSLPDKLNILQYEMTMQSRRPSLVTAFSIDALVTYLNYLSNATKGIQPGDNITESKVSHFWNWSKKFYNCQYVTIHKKLAV